MEKPCIVGVGGANVDLCGRSFGPILPGDSNPGQLTLSAGGVCRNICENVCRMGAPAALITVFGEDANGAQQSTGYYSEGSDELSSGTLAKGGTVSGNVYFKGDLARVLYFGNPLEKTATASWSLS